MANPGPLSIDEALSRAKKAVKKGNPGLAARLYRAILERQPDHPVAKKGLRRLERSAAQRRSAPASGSEPGQAELDPVIASYRAGRLDEVHRSCTALLERFPRSVLVLNLLGSALQSSADPEGAVEAFGRAIRLNPGFADAYVNRANALRDLGRFDAAMADYDAAIRLRPDNPVAYLNRGNALKDRGRLADAVRSYEAAIEQFPRFAQAHRYLSFLKTYSADDPAVEQLRRFVDDPETPDADRQEFCFALAKAYDDVGRHDDAFRVLEDGNRLRKTQLGYDIAQDRRLFDAIRREFPAWRDNMGAIETGGASPRPIFIVGMPRSGTTLVEQILASHSDVCGAGELEVANRLFSGGFSRDEQAVVPAATAVRETYLDALRQVGGDARFVTDKMPLNFRWLGFLLTAVPEARIVHTCRDAVATCWSNYRHFFPDEGVGFAYSLADLHDFYGLYRQLMEFWREQFPASIHELDYEKLTLDTEQETARLLAYCGLAWQDACLDFHETDRIVKTASAAQVRRSIYTGSSEAWRPYQRYLGPLLPLRDDHG